MHAAVAAIRAGWMAAGCKTTNGQYQQETCGAHQAVTGRIQDGSHPLSWMTCQVEGSHGYSMGVASCLFLRVPHVPASEFNLQGLSSHVWPRK